jgi:MFS family permease
MTALDPTPPAGARKGRSAPAPGTARAALAVPAFRTLWIGSFGSSIGTWMQQVALPAYAERRWGSATFVGLLIFAQLGPLLLLSIVGGVIADKVDRRIWLISMQTVQMVFSLALAVLVLGDPGKIAVFCAALGVGVGNAFNAPAWQATLPMVVGRENIPGMVSLNSTMINGTRVLGPALAGVLLPFVGVSGIFAINAATYLFVIGALFMIPLPKVKQRAAEGWRAVLVGFRVARERPVVGRCLVAITVFSFFCIVYVGQFPVIAARNLGMDPQSLAYGLLYAAFGLGAAGGGLSIGTFLSKSDKKVLARRMLMAYVVASFAFAWARHPAVGFAMVPVMGFFYFGFTTALLTVLQGELDDEVRGRVMALWFMGFGGTVSLSSLVFGPVIDATNATVPLVLGSAVAALIAWRLDLRKVASRRSPEAQGPVAAA